MVGRGGVEPPTSRLSGVRSNHLSYRPSAAQAAFQQRKARKWPAQLSLQPWLQQSLVMKGHEDGGI